jgi:hypothetical protein
MTSVFTITDLETNLDWTVRVVFQGDRYGRDMCLVHDDVEPMIEFYDAEYNFEKDVDGRVLGQFVSRYYAETLLNDHDISRGLNLDGGIPRWTINEACYRVIICNCAEIINQQYDIFLSERP